MTELKREYVVPLRRSVRSAPRWRRSKKAMSVLKDFVRKHMKTDTVIVCPELNAFIWERGSKHPPGKVGVVALKTTVNNVERVFVNLVEVGVSKQMELYGKGAGAVSSSVQDVKSKEVKKEKTEKTSKKEEAKEVVSKEKVEAEEPAKKEDEK